MHERRKILVAITDELDMEFFDLMLTKLGFEVLKTADGQAALDKIKQKEIDLALLNTILPHVSGQEILKTVKNDPDLAWTQIIMISDLADVKEKLECYDLGADDYINRPFNFSVLLARIRKALRNSDLYFGLGRRGAAGNGSS